MKKKCCLECKAFDRPCIFLHCECHPDGNRLVDWETKEKDEFAKKFAYHNLNGGIYHIANQCYEREADCQNIEDYWIERMKLRESALKQELAKVIEGLEKNNTIGNAGGGSSEARCNECGKQEECTCDVYNQALNDVLNLLPYHLSHCPGQIGKQCNEICIDHQKKYG